MKKIIVCICMVMVFMPLSGLYAQAPGIEWENATGGNASDVLYSAIPTADGGYLMSGHSNSDISAEKTIDNFGTSFDYWIIKYDASGTEEWQHTYGGTGTEEVCIVRQTTDGGYIVGGSSDSPKDGNKNSNSYGGTDYWILKLNTIGAIVWQRKIGGAGYEILSSIEQTDDGGYILGGDSYTAGIAGNKTEAGMGMEDYYVVKLDGAGNIEWQNTIGGLQNDNLKSVKPTSDGGYILAGYSFSSLSGDKTEASVGAGYHDFWILKLDSVGSIIWQNTIGGNFDDFCKGMVVTDADEIVLAGHSNSGVSGDKSVSSIGTTNPWIVKLNATGSIIWEKTLPIYEGYNIAIALAVDGSYIVGGNSLWLKSLTSAGVEEWSTTLTSGALRCIEQTPDGGYLLGATSNYGVTAVKSEPNYGIDDYWTVKLFPDACVPEAEICNAMDDNCNGLIDDGVTETISISAAGPTTFCSGGSVVLNATYTGVSLQWKKGGVNIPGATGPTYTATANGNYSCVTSSACGSSESGIVSVSVLKKPSAFIYADGPTLFCEGGSVNLIANTGGGLTYQWYKGAAPIVGATGITYNAISGGNYKCLVTKTASGCSKQSNSIAISVPCRENDFVAEYITEVEIYPNPAQSTITIQSSSEIPSTIQIRDMVGQLIIPEMSLQGHMELDVTAWPAGIYFLQSTTENEIVITQFVKHIQ